VEKLAIYGLKNDELLLVALMAMSAEKLIEHVLCIDEIFPFDVLEAFVIEVDELIKAIQELVFEVADIVWFFTGNVVVNEVNVFVVFGITEFFEEHHDVIFCDTCEPFSLWRVSVPGKEVMSEELLFELFVHFCWYGAVLFPLVLLDAVPKVYFRVVHVLT